MYFKFVILRNTYLQSSSHFIPPQFLMSRHLRTAGQKLRCSWWRNESSVYFRVLWHLSSDKRKRSLCYFGRKAFSILLWFFTRTAGTLSTYVLFIKYRLIFNRLLYRYIYHVLCLYIILSVVEWFHNLVTHSIQ